MHKNVSYTECEQAGAPQLWAQLVLQWAAWLAPGHARLSHHNTLTFTCMSGFAWQLAPLVLLQQMADGQ